jgi:CubicO group peptidase (beta-lactamase class C family)
MVDGTCADAFKPLHDVLERNLADGTDLGASVAVVHDGDLVVDLWGGEARPGQPWEHDTIVQVWSVTKAMVGLAALVLADRGVLDLDAPVAEYWPEFAAQGKGQVRVREVLGHRSGVPGWTRTVTVEDILDLELAEALLAEQEPWYEPGSAPAYQLINHGHLLDAIVRRAAGRPLADVLREDIVEPLGGGFHLGVPDDALGDCADLVPPPASGIDYSKLPPDNFLIRAGSNPLLTTGVCNSDTWRRGAVGGMGGHGNARAVAKVQAAVSHGGTVGGVDLLSPATIERIFEVQSDGTDLMLMVPLQFGIGFALPGGSSPAVPTGRVCWWTGYGGSIVVNDLDRRTTMAYTPNRMDNHYVASARTDEYVRTAFACLEDA